MKKSLFIVSIVSIMITTSIYPLSFKSFYSLFASEKYEDVEQQEIPVNKQNTLIIENSKGSIHIQSWQQPKILLKVTKHAAKQELLPNIVINIHSNKDRTTIKTVFANESTTGSAEYHLLVPEATNINTTSHTSSIKIEQITGTVTAKNEYGNIELQAIQGPSDVEITNKGSITIEQPGNSIKAITHYGNIDIHDAKKSIFASTDSGKIRTCCKVIPAGCTIKLDSSGPITLQLPSGTNADIQAETEQGSTICDHYVTIKPFITQLNSKAWTQFKRAVNGTLGNGGAQISLHSVSGNIKIMKPLSQN